MKGLDAHHYAVMDLYQDLIDKEDARSALAVAERARLLDLVIEAQGALIQGDTDIALCLLNEIERELS
jgi:hypothetical protein